MRRQIPGLHSRQDNEDLLIVVFDHALQRNAALAAKLIDRRIRSLPLRIIVFVEQQHAVWAHA